MCVACGAEWRPREEIGGYQLHERLARGGFSVIYRASDRAGGASVAVKIFARPHCGTAAAAVRFAEEIQTLAAYEHPHWLRIFGGGCEEDFAWLAMEWLPAGSLAARGRLEENEALEMAAQIADGLVAAQAHGLQHRNLCIGECLLADARTVKVSGFAEAVFYERAGLEMGTVWGQLSCAPPERVFEEPEDSRSEIYALGAILFQLLTGALPYEGETMPELFVERLDGPPPHVPLVRESTAARVDRMLAVDPRERFSSWEETSKFLHKEIVALSQAAAPAQHRAVSTTVARRVEKAPVDSPADGAWFTILMLTGIVGIAGWFGWKHFQTPPVEPPAPVAEIVALSTPPPSPPPKPAPAKTAPLIAAIPHTESASPPPPSKPARPKLDWGPWKKFILESPNRPGIGKGSENKIPGSGALRLNGNNSGMSGGHDENLFYARQMDGDWTFTARVSANDGAAGMVAREGIGSERPCVGIFIAADGKPSAVLRERPAAKLVPAPVVAGTGLKWMRIARRGTAMSAFLSPDGKHWREAATLNLPALPASVPVGFVVWSGTKEKLAGATFEEVALQAEP